MARNISYYRVIAQCHVLCPRARVIYKHSMFHMPTFFKLIHKYAKLREITLTDQCRYVRIAQICLFCDVYANIF